MPRRKKQPLQLPASTDDASISTTTIYPTIEAMFLEEIASKPWFEKFSRETRRMIRFTFITAVAETMRTIAFRINNDQDTRVFDEFDKQIQAYDLEMHEMRDQYASAILGLPN